MFSFITYKPALRKKQNINYGSFLCCYFSENIEDD